MFNREVHIGERAIGPGHPVYVIAELSANHGQRFEDAVALVEQAKACGADAVKLQTYTPDTITIDSHKPMFQIHGTAWEGETLYSLYSRAYTPWEWHGKLADVARRCGLDLFSSPFDFTAVDLLEEIGVPAYKIASSEIVDIPLIKRVASCGKPVIISTGMATLGEIGEALDAVTSAGGHEVALLKCTASYPAEPADMHLRTIPVMSETFGTPVGLSDHSLCEAVPVTAVALGATLVEKHMTLSRSIPGPDSKFSLEPHEFRSMVEAIRTAERALGTVTFGPVGSEAALRDYRRSLFVVEDVAAGGALTPQNVKSIRPGYGLHTRHLDAIIGRRAASDIARGTPLSWDLVEGGKPSSGE